MRPGRYSAPCPELIHTCYRIGDIDRSVAFYEALGFEERRRMPIRDEAINVFMGLPGDGDRLELTYNHGVDSYELGTGYNHIAITADDLDATLAKLGEQGIEPEKPPYRSARAGRASLRARPRRLPHRAHRALVASAAMDDAWFIRNVADMAWSTVPGGGTWCVFENDGVRSPTLGIGVHVLPPGETPGFYHRENQQEGFLVLAGECIASSRARSTAWGRGTTCTAPPGTAHITIGAEGDEPCAILMVGTRSPDDETQYLADPVAAKHGAAVATPTDDAREAYAGRPPFAPAPAPFPPRP